MAAIHSSANQRRGQGCAHNTPTVPNSISGSGILPTMKWLAGFLAFTAVAFVVAALSVQAEGHDSTWLWAGASICFVVLVVIGLLTRTNWMPRIPFRLRSPIAREAKAAEFDPPAKTPSVEIVVNSDGLPWRHVGTYMDWQGSPVAEPECPAHGVPLLFQNNRDGEVSDLHDYCSIHPKRSDHQDPWGLLFCPGGPDGGHTMVFSHSTTVGEAKKKAAKLIQTRLRAVTG